MTDQPDTIPAMTLTAWEKADDFSTLVGKQRYSISLEFAAGSTRFEALQILAQALASVSDEILSAPGSPKGEIREVLDQIMHRPDQILSDLADKAFLGRNDQ